MVFFINGDLSDNGYIIDKVSELKQHINLSEFAWNIIDEDIRNFSVDGEISFSGFLNTVFLNFYSEADASISKRYVEKSDELNEFFSSKEFSGNPEITEIYISKLLDKYEKELVTRSFSYPKGTGKKFRLNKASLEVLRESSETVYYDDSIGYYLKAIFEEYCTKPNYIREQIFFNDIKREIDAAIIAQNKIQLTILQKYNSGQDRYYSKKFIISPYKLLQDGFMSFNYLVGFAEELLPGGTRGEARVASFRLSRITKVSPYTNRPAALTKAKTSEIEDAILKKGLQFLAGDLINIKIRFTNKGLENLARQLYMRPHTCQKLSADTFVFTCTEVQAINYFFKFGMDAQILEPDYLRKKFISRYQSALNGYSTEE